MGGGRLLNRKKAWVYILADGKGRLYTGCTTNLRKRLQAHFSSRVRSTKGWTGLRLVYAESLPSYSLARRREAEIKKMSKSQKLKLLERGIPEEVRILMP